MGLSLHNALAVLEGGTRKKTLPFCPTPKFNAAIFTVSSKVSRVRALFSGLLLLEGLLVLYFLRGRFFSLPAAIYPLPFHVLLGAGFALVFGYAHGKSSADCLTDGRSCGRR